METGAKYDEPLNLDQAPVVFDDDMPVASPELMREILIKGRRRAGVPERYLRVGFDDVVWGSDSQKNWYALARKYASRFQPRDYPGMIMCGRVGTGKTMNACALVNYLSDRNFNVHYINLAAMFDRVRETYSQGSHETRTGVINDYISYDLLVIDELGVHHGTADERNIISRIVDGRYNKMRPTVLVGNLNKDEMIQYVGEHVMDRVLAGGGPLVVFDWDSRRNGLKR